MKKLIWIFFPLMSTLAIAQKAEDLTKFGKVITVNGLKDKLTILASAEMEGRETATPGQKRAAAYIESEFKRMGLQPGNGDSYQQLYPVYQDALTEKKLVVNGKNMDWDKDFNFSMQTIASGNFNYSSIVFAGYGIVDTEKGINDYANLDVKGKVVVVVEGSSAGMPTMGAGGSRAMNANPASPAAKMRAASSKGAIGLLFVSADFPKKMATQVKGGMYLKKNNAPGFLMVNISAAVASSLLGN
nr:hypothetical protein [Sediminibacterium sp.]